MTDEIPDRIADVMEPEERANMRQRKGWATGTAVHIDENGQQTRRLEDVWVELFNGHGGAGVFGGVRFQWTDGEEYDEEKPWADDGGYEEVYAYATKEAAEDEATAPYWYIAEYNEDDVDYGIPAP